MDIRSQNYYYGDLRSYCLLQYCLLAGGNILLFVWTFSRERFFCKV